MPMMPGMLTPQQMQALAKATGTAFDRLFLTGMIQHHIGALVMVEELFDTPGAGQDDVLYDFATDVDNTQRAEIDIMRGMLKGEKMIVERTSRRSRSTVTLSLALSALFPRALRRANRHNPRPAAPATPRSVRIRARQPTIRASDSKADYQDAGEAAFGMERLATLPKPPGFAPGDATATPAPASDPAAGCSGR